MLRKKRFSQKFRDDARLKAGQERARPDQQPNNRLKFPVFQLPPP